MKTEELIGKIKERGYWEVVIKPAEFIEKRISSKDDSAKIITDNKIVLRGWDYPHIDIGGPVRMGKDSVASYCDWPAGGHFEYWQFYQNSLFIHYFSMIEDYNMDEKGKEIARRSFSFSGDNKVDKFLSIINALYVITEIHLFAANLAKTIDLGKEVEITIKLGGAEGRTLFFWGEWSRHLFSAYTCAYNLIDETRTYLVEDLINNAASFALDFTIDIFKEFNWRDASKNVFIEDQKKLIERRL